MSKLIVILLILLPIVSNAQRFWMGRDSVRVIRADSVFVNGGYVGPDTMHIRHLNSGFSGNNDPWMLRLLGRNDIGGPHFHHNWANSNFTQFTVNYGQMSVGFATPSTGTTSGARAAFYKVLTAGTKVDSAIAPIANIPIAQMNVFMHRGQTSSLVSSGSVYDYSNGSRWIEAWVDSVAADGTVAVRSELYAKNTGSASIPTGTLGLRINKFGNVVIPQQLMVGSTNNPSSSAALQINSTTSGVLFPRMTTTERDAISNPIDGLVIYNTTANKLQVRSSSAWVDLH